MFISHLQKQEKVTLHNYLKKLKYGKVLIIFDHGLGDYIMFINLFEELISKYPNIKFSLGYNENFDCGGLHPNMYRLTPKQELSHHQVYATKRMHMKYDILELEKKFDIVVEIIFPELPSRLSKMQLCNVEELGLDRVVNAREYRLYNKKVTPIDKTNFFGLHFTPNSGLNVKSITMDNCKLIWNVLTDLGYTPLLFYTKFRSNNPEYLTQNFDWITNPKQKITSQSDLNDLMLNIAKCKYFFGVLSGPICLAHNILGEKRCCGYYSRDKTIEDYLEGSEIPSINNVTEDNIKRLVRIVEKRNST